MAEQAACTGSGSLPRQCVCCFQQASADLESAAVLEQQSSSQRFCSMDRLSTGEATAHEATAHAFRLVTTPKLSWLSHACRDNCCAVSGSGLQYFAYWHCWHLAGMGLLPGPLQALIIYPSLRTACSQRSTCTLTANFIDPVLHCLSCLACVKGLLLVARRSKSRRQQHCRRLVVSCATSSWLLHGDAGWQ